MERNQMLNIVDDVAKAKPPADLRLSYVLITCSGQVEGAKARSEKLQQGLRDINAKYVVAVAKPDGAGIPQDVLEEKLGPLMSV